MKVDTVVRGFGIQCFLESVGEVGVSFFEFGCIFEDEGAYEHVSVHVALAEGAEWMILSLLLRLQINSLLFLR